MVLKKPWCNIADDLDHRKCRKMVSGGILDELTIHQALPDGVTPFDPSRVRARGFKSTDFSIGLVDVDEGPKLQGLLKPGQRLVSTEGLWRWDVGAWSEDAPTATSLRLEQLNRLKN